MVGIYIKENLVMFNLGYVHVYVYCLAYVSIACRIMMLLSVLLNRILTLATRHLCLHVPLVHCCACVRASIKPSIKPSILQAKSKVGFGQHSTYISGAFRLCAKPTKPIRAGKLNVKPFAKFSLAGHSTWNQQAAKHAQLKFNSIQAALRS